MNDDIYMTFDNLPFADGNRSSGSGVRAGLYPYRGGKRLTYTGMEYAEEGSAAYITFRGTEAGDFTVALSESGVRFEAESDFYLVNESRKDAVIPEKSASGDTLTLKWRGFEYKVRVSQGFLKDENTFVSSGRAVVLDLSL